MIELSGRLLSRAWLAVALASSDDEDRPALYRAVHIEVFPDGVRLIATDSYWLALCWVPATPADPDLELPAEPPLGVMPECTVTVNDDEWRVRDMLRHVAKVTKKPDALDVIVSIDPEVSTYDQDTPTLSPDLAALRASIGIPGERIQARTHEGPWPDWRALLAQFSAAPTGKPSTTFSAWMLDRFSKVPKIVGAATVSLQWLDGTKGRWAIDTEQPVIVRPRGVFAHVLDRRDTTTADDEDADEPDA